MFLVHIYALGGFKAVMPRTRGLGAFFKIVEPLLHY